MLLESIDRRLLKIINYPEELIREPRQKIYTR